MDKNNKGCLKAFDRCSKRVNLQAFDYLNIQNKVLISDMRIVNFGNVINDTVSPIEWIHALNCWLQKLLRSQLKRLKLRLTYGM